MKTDTKTGLIIVATLLIGILIGALGSGFMVHRFARRMADMRHRDMFVERMIELIQPAPEQEAEVRDILTRHAEEFTKLADGFQEDTAALFDSLRSELDPVLTDEQKERMEERHERLGKFLRHGHRPPHDKPGGAPRRPPPGDDG
jgi:hypothetical protein